MVSPNQISGSDSGFSKSNEGTSIWLIHFATPPCVQRCRHWIEIYQLIHFFSKINQTLRTNENVELNDFDRNSSRKGWNYTGGTRASVLTSSASDLIALKIKAKHSSAFCLFSWSWWTTEPMCCDSRWKASLRNTVGAKTDSVHFSPTRKLGAARTTNAVYVRRTQCQMSRRLK